MIRSIRGLLLICIFTLSAWADNKIPTTAPAPFTKSTLDNLEDLRALQASLKSVVARVSPAVVGLRVGSGQGSGVIISADGFVLTAGHVSSMPNQNVTVLLSDGKAVKGKTLGANYSADSGLIKITERGPIDGKWPFVEMGKSADLKKGQWCLALGHPGGYKNGRSPPLRLGRVIEPKGTFIRTDCTLVGGDSGGPLFDLAGKVIGIHSRIGSAITDNMHVPVDSYRDTWDRLAKGEAWGGMLVRPRGPWLGIQIDNENPRCVITEVFKDSPAEKAGLKEGDIIESFNRKPVKDMQSLMMLLLASRAGDEVTLTVNRDGEKKDLKATLARRPQQ